MRRLILLAVLGVATGTAGTAAAATPPAGYRAVRTTEIRIVYETRRVSYTKEETRYDHCDRPYTVQVTCYRTVEVTVTRYARCDY